MEGRRYRILCIEDSPTDRKLYRRFLEHPNAQLEILEAATAERGLELCRISPPDCIILDFRLPDRDGLELIPDLKKITEAPIIFVTGQAVVNTLTEAYRSGVFRFLSKEYFGSADLREVVWDALGVPMPSYA